MFVKDILRVHYFCNINESHDKYNLCSTFWLCLMALRLKKEMKIH